MVLITVTVVVEVAVRFAQTRSDKLVGAIVSVWFTVQFIHVAQLVEPVKF